MIVKYGYGIMLNGHQLIILMNLVVLKELQVMMEI